MDHAQPEARQFQQDMLIEQRQRGRQEVAVVKAHSVEFRRNGDRPALEIRPRERGPARRIHNCRVARLACRPPVDRPVDQLAVPVLGFELLQRDLRDGLRHGFYLDIARPRASR